jgi:hypothetical protein
MKLAKLLDQEGSNLVSDPFNQAILKELVYNEHSVSDLAQKLNLPTLKLWRRMQKLLKANLVELTKTEKVGNIEKKLYRATATWFAPQQYFDFKPKDPNLKAAYEIHSEIQKKMMNKILSFGDIPKEADPIDFSLFANMQAFAQICGTAEIQTKISELKVRLADFEKQSGYLETQGC